MNFKLITILLVLALIAFTQASPHNGSEEDSTLKPLNRMKRAKTSKKANETPSDAKAEKSQKSSKKSSGAKSGGKKGSKPAASEA